MLDRDCDTRAQTEPWVCRWCLDASATRVSVSPPYRGSITGAGMYRGNRTSGAYHLVHAATSGVIVVVNTCSYRTPVPSVGNRCSSEYFERLNNSLNRDHIVTLVSVLFACLKVALIGECPVAALQGPLFHSESPRFTGVSDYLPLWS